MRRLVTTLAVCALLVTGWSATAQAGKWDAGMALALGAGGEIGVANADVDLEVTAGFTFFGDYEIWKYIDVGFLASFLWWELDIAGADRDLWIDLSPYVKGKYLLLNGKLELYGRIPLGLTINVGDKDTDGGMNTGLTVGAGYNVWSSLWVFADMGWALHWVNASTSFTANQFAFNMGASWSF